MKYDVRPLSAGFTLVELLVVMVLLSLLVLAMGSALRTTAQAEDRVDERLQRNDEMRVAVSFLQSTLGRISLAKKLSPVAAGETPFIFSAAPREMTWVGVMPARYGAGGRYHFRLAMENTQDGNSLVIRFVPWAPEQPPNWDRAESSVLVRGVTSFALQYEDSYPEPPQWTSDWTPLDHLPQRVSFSLQTTSVRWPDVAIVMRVLPVGDSSSRGAVFGGG